MADQVFRVTTAMAGFKPGEFVTCDADDEKYRPLIRNGFLSPDLRRSYWPPEPVVRLEELERPAGAAEEPQEALDEPDAAYAPPEAHEAAESVSEAPASSYAVPS